MARQCQRMRIAEEIRREEKPQRDRDAGDEDQHPSDQRREHAARAEEEQEDRLDGTPAHASAFTSAKSTSDAAREAAIPARVIAAADRRFPRTNTGAIVL